MRCFSCAGKNDNSEAASPPKEARELRKFANVTIAMWLFQRYSFWKLEDRLNWHGQTRKKGSPRFVPRRTSQASRLRGCRLELNRAVTDLVRATILVCCAQADTLLRSISDIA
jgi:hypothetical protein